MKIALIGGTGFVGSALLDELLSRGHRVSALARHPQKYAARPGLAVVSADVLDASHKGNRIPYRCNVEAWEDAFFPHVRFTGCTTSRQISAGQAARQQLEIGFRWWAKDEQFLVHVEQTHAFEIVRINV